MVITITTQYGTANQAFTITLASLANGSLRASDAINNSVNLFLDAYVAGSFRTGAAPSADSTVEVFAYGSVDGHPGTLYSGGATGSDAAFTNNDQNLYHLGTIITDNSANADYEFGPFSVASAFPGGVLPESWGIVVGNNSGDALNAAGQSVAYQGIYGVSS